MVWLVVDNLVPWLVVDNLVPWLVVDNLVPWLVVDNLVPWLVLDDNLVPWLVVNLVGMDVLIAEMLTDSGVVWQMAGKNIVGSWSSVLVFLQAMSDDFTENMVLDSIVFIAEFV